MRTLLFLIILITSSAAHASHAFCCSSSDGQLQIDLNDYEGDGLVSLIQTYEISYSGHPTKLGLITWLKIDDHQLNLTNYSWTGRRVHVRAVSEGSHETLKVENGFIETEGKTVDLKDVRLECGAE